MRLRKRKNNGGKETRACEYAQEPAEDEMKSHYRLGGSLGPGGNCVKGWVQKGCAMRTERNVGVAKREEK